MAASPGVLKSSPKHLPAARVPNHSFFPIALKVVAVLTPSDG
jgi:hypothetical protein